MENILSARILFDGEKEYTKVDIAFNRSVITYIEPSRRGVGNTLVTPPYTDNYVALDDYISFLGLDEHTLSSLDKERVVRILCLRALFEGVLTITLDAGKDSDLIGTRCKDIELTYLYRINSVDELNKLPSLAIPVISEDTEPDEIIKIIEEIENKVIFLRFLVKRRDPFIYKEKTGYWPFQYFEKMRLFSLDKRYVFIYSNWLSSMDLEVLKHYSSKVMLIASASKTMELCSGGFAPLYEALDKGVKVGIATSGLSASPLEEASLIYRLYKYSYWDTRLDIGNVYRMIYTTYRGPTRISVNSKASFIVYRVPSTIIMYKKYLLYNKPVPLAVYRDGEKVFIREDYPRLISEIEELLGALK